MGLLERLDQLDRRAGLAGGSTTRPSIAAWVLLALLVAAGIGVVVAAFVVDGAGRTIASVVPPILGVAAIRWVQARSGTTGVVRVLTATLVIALALSIPAALLGFWQGTVLVLVIGVIPLIVLSLTQRGPDA